MNKKTTLPPEGVGGIETIEDILGQHRINTKIRIIQ